MKRIIKVGIFITSSILFSETISSLKIYNDILKTVSILEEKNGISYEINSNTPFTGTFIERYRNDKKKFKLIFKDGKANGLGTTWYRNGQKEFERHFINGMPDGPLKEWTKNGVLKK